MERIEGMRARNVARTNRFLNARLRTIGLDTDALDEQMRERRAREEMEGVSRSRCLFYLVLQSPNQNVSLAHYPSLHLRTRTSMIHVCCCRQV